MQWAGRCGLGLVTLLAMFYFSGYNSILRLVAVVAVTLALVFQPFHFAIAQEAPADPPPVEEPVVEPPPAEEPVQDPPPEEPAAEATGDPAPEPEPVIEGGSDGVDGGDAPGGADGTSPDDPPLDPQPGDVGTSTESGGDPPDEEPPAESGGDTTTIETGDASADGTIENQIDINELKVLLDAAYSKYNLPLGYVIYDHTTGKYIAYSPEAQVKLDKALEDGLVDPYEYLDIVTPELDTLASTTNETVLDNTADIGANTGGNTANNNDNVTINTGDARATSNVLNVVNTNIYNSEGFFLFLDNLSRGGASGSLDLRDYDFFNPTEVLTTTNQRSSAIEDNPVLKRVIDKVKAICPSCGGSGDLTVNTDQVAEITNDIVVRSGTGVNEASWGAGNASINTGDAYAAANVINLANTNIVDSNYLLLTYNNYGDWDGDLVFPSADSLIETFDVGGQSTPPIIANNTNTTDVNNSADLTAGTGDNTANGGGAGGSIATGDASASTNVLNELNSNLVGGTSFSILIKVHGEWAGDIVGAPEGVEWRETPNGVEIYYDPEGGGGGTASYDSFNITSDNTATINNNVEVIALTGENMIEGAGGSASITTGDASAAANIINVANTNVIGKNWLMAVVNIFGDWNGNLSFGVPNLWIGAKAVLDSPEPGPGTGLNFEYTVMNTGDAPANNVCLRNRFDSRYLSLDIQSTLTDRYINGDSVEYCIGTVEAGAVRELSRRARIAEDMPYGTTFISNNIEVFGAQDEEYLDDNEEFVSFEVWNEPPKVSSTSGARISYKPSPDLKITKSHSSPFGARASSTVNYRIVIRNEGPGSAYDAVLIDKLTHEDGSVIYEETWNLGEIYSNETIEISYTTFFNGASEQGVYTNSAYVKALSGYHNFLYGRNGDSETVESSVLILPALNVYYGEEVVEVVEDSMEVLEEDSGAEFIGEEVIENEEEVPVIITGVLGPLYSHPVFTQHPVYANLPHIAASFSHPVFSKAVWGSPLLHPQFTQHPVHNKRTVLTDIIRSSDNLRVSWLQSLSNSFFISALKWPFDKVTVASAFEEDTEPSENKERVLVLLAMSIFIMDSRRKNGNSSYYRV